MTLKILHLSEPFGRVTYQEKGQGIPAVLIHGVGMQSAAWKPQIDALSNDFTVIALDMPGHGGSDPLAGTPELPDYVAWLDEVLKALGLKAVHLAGHSMGALISGGYAVSHPKRVLSVTLVNGVFKRTTEAREAVQNRAKTIAQGEFDLETPLSRWFGDDVDQIDARTQVAGWLSAVNHKGYADAYSAFANGDEHYADRFSEIACPLLALTGDKDPNSTPAMSKAMAAAAPKGRAIILENQRHMMNLTAIEPVNTILRDWLAASTGTGETK